MNRFDTLIAAAKTARIENCNEAGNNLSSGAAIDGEFRVVISPVEGHVSSLNTVKIRCYINNKVASMDKMRAAMNG